MSIVDGRLLRVYLVLLVGIVCAPLLGFQTPDTTLSVIPWYQRIAAVGYPGLGETFPNTPGGVAGNYTPPYYYLLFIASLFNGLLPDLYLIKLISIAFAFLAGFFAYKIARYHCASDNGALLAASTVVLAPTDIANGAWWGQCDMVWTALILGSFFFTVVGRSTAAIMMFGMAIAFKAQAIFFAPFLFMLFIRGDLRLWHLAGIPLIYGAIMLPAILLGRAPLDVFAVYLRQSGRFAELSMNAPNLYAFVPNKYYAAATAIGLGLTVIASVTLAYLPRLTKVELDAKAKLLTATMFVALSPFLLPKMHDRYFFAADIFSIVLALCQPELWLVPVMFQISSLLAYTPIISLSLSGNMFSTMIPLAGVLNAATVAFLIYLYWLACTRPGAPFTSAIKEFTIIASALCSTVALWLSVTLVWRFLAERHCPHRGLMGVVFCDWKIPANLLNASWIQRMLFALLLAVSYASLRIAIPNIQKKRRSVEKV
jgi:Gpi18-like mannosyltransferase